MVIFQDVFSCVVGWGFPSVFLHLAARLHKQHYKRINMKQIIPQVESKKCKLCMDTYRVEHMEAGAAENVHQCTE